MADRKRCCCNCERNIRHEVAPHGIECYCEIDGYRIGYIECFEGWCRRWKKDRIYCLGRVDPMTDDPLPECLACPDFVDKAQDDLEAFYKKMDGELCTPSK